MNAPPVAAPHRKLWRTVVMIFFVHLTPSRPQATLRLGIAITLVLWLMTAAVLLPNSRASPTMWRPMAGSPAP